MRIFAFIWTCHLFPILCVLLESRLHQINFYIFFPKFCWTISFPFSTNLQLLNFINLQISVLADDMTIPLQTVMLWNILNHDTHSLRASSESLSTSLTPLTILIMSCSSQGSLNSSAIVSSHVSLVCTPPFLLGEGLKKYRKNRLKSEMFHNKKTKKVYKQKYFSLS